MKRNEIYQNEMIYTETKQNETKSKRNETYQNETIFEIIKGI